MGVPFYEKENIMNGNNFNTNNNTSTTDTSTSCNCNVCNPQAETTTTSTQTSTLNLSLKKSGIFKEIIGNCKEVRIDENNHNLRIVGNNNRIRIAYNIGDLIIIGNNTRLKITINHGQIKYTGNDGRIYLGEDSTEQLVDYSGCNGVLKVANSKKFELNKSSQTNNSHIIQNNNCVISNEIKSSAMGNTFINKQCIGMRTTKNSNNKKPNRKSSSYGGSSSCSNKSDNTYASEFNIDNVFKRKKSMPNIINSSSSSTSTKTNIMRPSRIEQYIGNIVITNSANICITPFTN